MLWNTARLFAGFALLTLVMLSARYDQQAASAQTPHAKSSTATAKEKPAAPKMTQGNGGPWVMWKGTP